MQFPLNAVISFVGNTAATSAAATSASSNISNQQHQCQSCDIKATALTGSHFGPGLLLLPEMFKWLLVTC